MNITQQESISMTETKLSGGLKEGGILKKNTYNCWIYFWLKYNYYCNNFRLVEYGLKVFHRWKLSNFNLHLCNPHLSRLYLNLRAKERQSFHKMCVWILKELILSQDNRLLCTLPKYVHLNVVNKFISLPSNFLNWHTFPLIRVN